MRPITTGPWRRPLTRQRVARPGSTIDANLRQLVHRRASGRCECCADPLTAGWECHHRKLRSRGGQDSAANLVALCRLCHRRVHGRPAWARETGFMVESWDDPATVLVAVGCAVWVRLTPDGSYGAEADA